jgi:tRNA pseudouridine55 synthase
VNGVLIINKPQGWTSHDVVNKCRRILQERQIGHTGTLDPLATGVLVLCIGKATKIVRYLEADDKEYTAELKLGITTDTQDADGKVLEAKVYSPPSIEKVRDVMNSFQGKIHQQPPAFSALKVNGIPSYRLARKGTIQEHKARPVTIHELKLIDFVDPVARFTVRCSKGTYVRTLCADIGDRLGMGAHLISLIRTRAGRFLLETALTLEQTSELAASGQAEKALIPLNDAVGDFPSLLIEESDIRRIEHGNAVSIPIGFELTPSNGPIRISTKDGRLLAMARAREGKLRPEVVFV